MNPIWARMIFDAAREVPKRCSHCKRAAPYAIKRAGQFYKCRYCGKKFKEKGA